MKRPNVVLVFGDQWRAQATGYAGDPNVKTPRLDRLAEESVNFTHAVSGCPVCSPARASLLTGQLPLTHRVIVNDVCLKDESESLADAFKGAGYAAGYIGKWHVDGHGRSNYIPSERRQGFDYWKVLECTHDYNNSPYYDGDSEEKLHWEGYDAIAQTRDAQQYIRDRDGDKPFLLVLSWGPPHAPYHTAPEKYREMYRPEEIELADNVPETHAEIARDVGVFHDVHLGDDCVGDLLDTLEEEEIADDTIFLFFSDHGDMIGAHGMDKKQKPWEESIRIPFLLRYPALLGKDGKEVDALIDLPDVMPTLLSLCDIAISDSVEGLDYSAYLRGGEDPSDGSALLTCPHPFGQWWPGLGGRAYRGLRTRRYTYVRVLEGPWLLYDNREDPYQQVNLIGRKEHRDLLYELDAWLQRRLDDTGDEFLPSVDYIRRWGYKVDERGTVPYTL